MPVVTFDYNDFINLLGHKISKKELIERLPMIGADLDKVEDDEISIEFFPDRPDLASVEGIVRASRAFFKFKTGLKKYEVKKSDIVTNVESSVK
jgi:phenylalanyl-tRNA synthetase beta chain